MICQGASVITGKGALDLWTDHLRQDEVSGDTIVLYSFIPDML